MPIHYNNHNNIITLGKQIKNTAKSQWAFDKVKFLLSKGTQREGKKTPHQYIDKKPHLKKNHLKVYNIYFNKHHLCIKKKKKKQTNKQTNTQTINQPHLGEREP